MNFTSLFFENFMAIITSPFQTLGTTGSSASMGVSTTLTSATDSFTDGVKQFTSEDGSNIAGTLCCTSATASVAALFQANDIDFPNVQITKAYVESLDEEQLTELIANLDGIEFDVPEEENVLAKRI